MVIRVRNYPNIFKPADESATTYKGKIMNNLGNALGNISNNKSTIEQLYDSINSSKLTKDIGEIIVKNSIAKSITDEIIEKSANMIKKLIPSEIDAKKLFKSVEKGKGIETAGFMYIDVCHSGLMFQLKNLLSKTEYNRIDNGYSKLALAGLFNSNKKDRVAKNLKIDISIVDRIAMPKMKDMINKILNKAFDKKTINIIDNEKIAKMFNTIENTLNAESNKTRVNKFQTQDSLKKTKEQLLTMIKQSLVVLNTK